MLEAGLPAMVADAIVDVFASHSGRAAWRGTTDGGARA